MRSHGHIVLSDKHINTLGIIGGVGPIASAEFLRTIYEQCNQRREQHMPKVLMCSDPGFPARTASVSAHAERAMTDRLRKNLRSLDLLGASHVVLCCITMHHLLPRLPLERKKVISLVDVIFSLLDRSPQPHIVLCSTRTSNVGLFQQHHRWSSRQDLLIFPNQAEQRQIQDLILHLKCNGAPRAAQPLLKQLVKKYGTHRFICGCTEMHLLTKTFLPGSGKKSPFSFLDPLMSLAKTLGRQRAV